MKKCISYLPLFLAGICYGQQKLIKPAFGIKAGYNFCNFSDLTSVKGSNLPGFHFGAFYSGKDDDNINGTVELLFSRQGYNYAVGGKKGKVHLNYLSLPVFADFKIGDDFKFQIGLTISYLFSGKVDSSTSVLPGFYKTTTDYFNRFDFAVAGGIVYNFSSKFITGARYSVGINNATKKIAGPIPVPPFIPASPSTLKNNLFQLYIGYKLVSHD